MPNSSPVKNSLVLYKQKPARVRQVGSKKLTIELEGSGKISVRPKDVMLLHPGPLNSFAQLQPLGGEIETAWELLDGETTNLRELAELAYDEYSIQSAWAAWQYVADGLYFRGNPDEIQVLTLAEANAVRAARSAKEDQRIAWDSFLQRIAVGETAAEDDQYIRDIVALALEQRKESNVLKALGQAETPENAHALLLKLGVWDDSFNPYPLRVGLPTTSASVPLDPLPQEARHDLTHLQAYAIDDEGSHDPDDALSWDKGRLWVHIADVAALVPPDSPADYEARARGANLYLPEGTVTMLPPEATRVLALGLDDISPALSFGLDLDENGEIIDFEILPSLIRVTRVSYRETEMRLDKSPFKELLYTARLFEASRRENGAIHIDLPEVKVRVVKGEVEIRPLPKLSSRDLVREAMLMVGEAVARYAIENDIAIPFATQTAPISELPSGASPSAYFATRMLLKPGNKSTAPGSHAGLGMEIYAQATSPLRRYLDLVLHQQLRAHLLGKKPMDANALTTLIGSADSGTRYVRRTERLSNRHWTCVYLLQNPGWQGEGIVVEKRGLRHKIILPQLGLETDIFARQDLPLDSKIEVELRDVDLVHLETNFRQK